MVVSKKNNTLALVNNDESAPDDYKFVEFKRRINKIKHDNSSGMLSDQNKDKLERGSDRARNVRPATGGSGEGILPFPELSGAQLDEIKHKASEVPWALREHYWMSPFEWLKQHYGKWIPGMTQSHLRAADPQLYGAFIGRVQREGLPADLDIPTKSTARERIKAGKEALPDNQEPSLTELTPAEIKTLIEYAKRHPWSARETHRMSAFDWIRQHYKRWIPGLTQGHLKAADHQLYMAFKKRVEREGLPADLDIPTRNEITRRLVRQKRARELASDHS
jgi:hypothetical protein